jgi:phage/plasmid-like protein (TIGR03299 family)
MSHELDFSKGFAAIAIGAGTDTPWHGLVNDYLTPDDTPETAVKKGGLDWSVHKSPVTYKVGQEERSFENRSVLFRSDTGDALSVMSESHYVPAQPIDLVRGLYEVIRGSGFVIDCIMALKGGRVISALARREAEPGQLGDDIHLPYLGIMTSFDGTFARQANLTAIRRVCMNTVRFSLADSQTVTAKQRNSRDFTIEKANDLFDKLGEFDKGFASYMETMRAMAAVKMTDDKLKRFFAKLYAPEVFTNEEQWQRSAMDWDKTKMREGKERLVVSTNARNTIADLINLYRDSPGSSLPSADGTLYGAFNAVTYHVDHEARTKTRNGESEDAKRWESASTGNGARMKEKALELASSLI